MKRVALGLTVLALIGLITSCTKQQEPRASNSELPGTGSPVAQDFVSGGDAHITLESGEYDVRPSADNRIHVSWNEAIGKRVRATITVNGRSAEVKVENTPNDFHARIEVPPLTNLNIELTAGELSVGDVKGNKDIEVNAGDVIVNVGKSSDWAQVEASVTAGDVHAPAFQSSTGGLFRSLHWSGPGKYRLHVHVAAGNVTLKS